MSGTVIEFKPLDVMVLEDRIATCDLCTKPNPAAIYGQRICDSCRFRSRDAELVAVLGRESEAVQAAGLKLFSPQRRRRLEYLLAAGRELQAFNEGLLEGGRG